MHPPALLGPLGWPELVVIFFIVLLVFGPRKLPDVAEALGKSIQKFKKASRDVKKEIEEEISNENHDGKDLKG